MIRKMATEKNNSDQTARITITGYLIEMAVIALASDEYEIREINKGTGENNHLTTAPDFPGAVTLAENHLRDRAMDEKIDGYETLDSVSD